MSVTLDDACRLDVRSVLRVLQGQPAALQIIPLPEGGRVGATLRGNRIELDYTSDGSPRRQVLQLVSTPCAFGGARLWARCPPCGTKRAVLYTGRASGGYFVCRTCLGWPYASTHERTRERARRRAMTIRRRLGYTERSFWAPLRRPPYQRLTTFARLEAKHDAAMGLYREEMENSFARLKV